MKNRKQISLFLSLFFFLSFSSKSFSQGFYFDIGGGYGFNTLASSNIQLAYPLAPDWIPAQIVGSFGKGINYGGDIGYLFTPNYAFEVGVNELSGSTYTYSQTGPNSPSTIDQSNYGTMFRIIPTFKVTSSDGIIQPFGKVIPQNGGNKVDIYFKFGIIVGLINSVHSSQTLTYSDATGPKVVTTDITYSGGTSMGYTFRVGLAIKQSDKIFFFVEGALNSQFYIPTEGKRSTYVVNDVDQLSTLPDSQKQTTFTSNENYPFGSLGVNIGVQYKMENQVKPKRWGN